MKRAGAVVALAHRQGRVGLEWFTVSVQTAERPTAMLAWPHHFDKKPLMHAEKNGTQQGLNRHNGLISIENLTLDVNPFSCILTFK